ncbi:MAG: caspase family protein [Cyclobacteriaceae bacterium]|nr:caspase family protein [Cyclobacteriaceae bacterium]
MRIISSIILLFTVGVTFAQQAEVSGQSGAIHLDFTSRSSITTVPEVFWKNPVEENTVVVNRRFVLQLSVKSTIKLDEVNVFLNDNPIAIERGFTVVPVKTLSDYERNVDTEVILRPGNNKILVSAKDKQGGFTSSIKQVIVKTNPDEEQTVARKDYALLFATDDYDSWDNSQNPIRDVSTIAADLKETYGFEIEIVKNPTKLEMMQKLREYARKTYLAEDQLFIMFAGHGYFDQLFNQGYLVCRDSKITDEERLTYISHNSLRSIIDNIPNKHIFLTIDACFGGTFDPYISSSAHRGGIFYDDLGNAEYISRKLKLKTRKFLTSGGMEYVSDGRPGQHSPFTRKLLEAIRSYGGSDGILTLAEMKSFIEKIDPEPRFGEFGSDEPGSDFIFIVK